MPNNTLDSSANIISLFQAKPTSVPVNPQGIPAELKGIRGWILWRYRLQNGVYTKKPINPHTGESFKPKTDASMKGRSYLETPELWVSFDEAFKAMSQYQCDGVGLVIHEDLGIGAIDCDKCLVVRGGFAEFIGGSGDDVAELYDDLKGRVYHEVSPSGTGARFLFRRRDGDSVVGTMKNPARHIYGHRHYVTITGQELIEGEGTGVLGELGVEALEPWVSRWGGASGQSSVSVVYEPMPDVSEMLGNLPGPDDLEGLGVSVRVRELLFNDDDSVPGERSDLLYRVCKELIEAGLSKAVVLGLLMESDFGYAVGHSGSRNGWEWVWKFGVLSSWAKHEDSGFKREARLDFEAVEGDEVDGIGGGEAGEIGEGPTTTPDDVFLPVDCGDFVDGCLDVEYLIKGVLEKQNLGVLYGPSGSGKSFVVLDMCFALARGDSYWRSPEHAITGAIPVAYVCAESAGGLRKRVLGRAQTLGMATEDMNDLPLKIFPIRPNLAANDRDLKKLIKSFGQDFENGLIVVDTLSQVSVGADENGPEMASIMSRLRHLSERTKATVLVVHHSGKDAERGARGHSSIKANADFELSVMRDKDKTSRRRELSTTKMKDGDDGLVLAFELRQIEVGRDSLGDVVTTCIVEHTELTTFTPIHDDEPMDYSEDALGKLVLEKIAQLREQGIPTTYNRLDTELRKKHIDGRAIKQLIDGLVSAGFIEKKRVTPEAKREEYVLIDNLSE